MQTASSLAGRVALTSRLQASRLCSRPFTTSPPLCQTSPLVPRIANPDLWKSMVPKFMRKQPKEEDEESNTAVAAPRNNPGMSLIVLGLVVGSFAMNILALRREMVTFDRKTEARINTLKEVIQGIRNGEDIDVKRLLGTGDPQAEKEWEEVIHELEKDNGIRLGSKRGAKKKTEDKEERGWFGRSSTPAPAEEASEEAPEEVKASKPNFMM